MALEPRAQVRAADAGEPQEVIDPRGLFQLGAQIRATEQQKAFLPYFQINCRFKPCGTAAYYSRIISFNGALTSSCFLPRL